MKYNIVKKGKVIGVFNSWDDCKSIIECYSKSILNSENNEDFKNKIFNVKKGDKYEKN